MPFTFSHPAAVIPLCRVTSQPIFVLAMVIGSISPDFGYYFRVFSLATFSHTVLGSVFVCIPAGLLLLAFLLFFRESILWLVPSRLRLILSDLLQISSKNRLRIFLQVSFWIWIGSLTHILWDSFTHKSGWFVTNFDILQSTVSFGEDFTFPMYYLLQQASTVFGLLIILFFTYPVFRHFSPEEGDRKGDLLRYGFWGALIVASILIATPFAMTHASHFDGLLRFRTFVFQIGIMAGAVFAFFTIASIAFASCAKK
jgi:hypothetical protein